MAPKGDPAAPHDIVAPPKRKSLHVATGRWMGAPDLSQCNFAFPITAFWKLWARLLLLECSIWKLAFAFWPFIWPPRRGLIHRWQCRQRLNQNQTPHTYFMPTTGCFGWNSTLGFLKPWWVELGNLSFKNRQQSSSSMEVSELLSEDDDSFVLGEAPEWTA